MSAAALLADLELDGFRVRADGPKLLVQPAERLTPALLADLQAHKQALLAVLAERQQFAAPKLWQPPPAEPATPRRFPGVPKPHLPPGTLSPAADVLRLVERAGVVAFDLETTGLNPRSDRARLLSVSDGKRALVLDLWACDPAPVWRALAGKVLVAHNAAFDLGFLWHAGVRDLPRTVCTYLLAKLLHAGTFQKSGLKECCFDYLNGLVLPKEEQASDWARPGLTTDQVEYARKDAAVLIPLLFRLNAAVEAAGLQKAADIELRALPAFVWLMQGGVPFDRPAWESLERTASEKKADLSLRMEALTPTKGQEGLFGPVEFWNWDSPKQVGEVLASLGFPVDTTNDAQLSVIPHPFAALLRDHRHQAQLVKMYGTAWLTQADIREGRVYPDWRQFGTDTGRTSCKVPNMQQIPREVEYRRCVKAPTGRVLVKADYSQLQLRIAAKMSGDAAMLRVYQARGDIHTATAQALLGKKDVTKADRQIAKSANFGLLFGMSAAGLRVYSKVTYDVNFTEEEAEAHREAFFRTYRGLDRWHGRVKKAHAGEARGTTGRRRLFHPHTPDTERINTPVQQDESDGLKTALALLWERRSECPGAFPVLAVHDEIVVEVDADQGERAKAWLVEAMLDGMEGLLAPVPCEVEADIRPTWGK